MDAYHNLAVSYDRLTNDVDYEATVDFYYEILKQEGLKPRTAVDLACGTGSVTAILARKGLQVIGEFCCITGREAELLEYRERARELAQKERDEYSETGVLSKHDRLSAEHMPDGMLEEILAYIRSVDCDLIQSIYLVRKTISESFFTSAFVIRFYGGTDQQRDEIMHKIFRYLDTYPVDWQFSLFDYFECRDIHFDKIEGSLVYRKADHNET